MARGFPAIPQAVQYVPCLAGSCADGFHSIVEVSSARHVRTHLVIQGLIRRRLHIEAIYVPVVHAKGGGDEHRVVALEVACPYRFDRGNVFCPHKLAAFLHCSCNL